MLTNRLFFLFLVFFLCPCLMGDENKISGKEGKYRISTVPFPVDISRGAPSHLTKGILSRDGYLWVASEGSGVYRYDPRRTYQAWEPMNMAVGFPETSNVYALAEDGMGRIWAGTDNKGVVVFNGSEWKQYDRGNALLGDRVFDIAVSPATGEIAVATSGGVSIYNPSVEKWFGITRADGLAEDQVQALGFGEDGWLWVAFPCGGVGYASPRDGYRKWKVVQAPWYLDKKKRLRQPLIGSGMGLPSNLGNAVLPGKGGNIWLGTNSGLAFSLKKKGWQYVRGEDFKAKNKGLYGGSPIAPASKPSSINFQLPEDYVTCMAETDEGLWVGFRREGAALVDTRNWRVSKHVKGDKKRALPCKYITSIIPLPDGRVCATTYGGGLVLLKDSDRKWPICEREVDYQKPYPKEAVIPGVDEIKKTMERLLAWEKLRFSKSAFFQGEDWTTQGDWCERYGREYAMLCAGNAPVSNQEYFFDDKSGCSGVMGPNRQTGDSLRNWVHWTNREYNRNVLYCPTDATRTESEWDDHGEAYSLTFDGPDVWSIVKVPKGRHLLSLYFYNPNGQETATALRDYLVEIREYLKPSQPASILLRRQPSFGLKLPADYLDEEIEKALESEVLARCRVKDFAGSGVYKTFIVEGDRYYFVRVCRNYSFNTILNAVFLDSLTEWRPESDKVNGGHWLYLGVYPKAKEYSVSDENAPRVELWKNTMARMRNDPLSASLGNQIVLDLYRGILSPKRAGSDDAKNRDLEDNWNWHLKVWNADLRREFDKVMNESWRNKQKSWPMCRSKRFMPYAPNVIDFTPDEIEWMDKLNISWEQYLPGKSPTLSPEEVRKKISVARACRHNI